MKFGKTFPNHQVPEWSHQYVNYKNLKKLIKQITRTQEKLHRNHLNEENNHPPVKQRDTSRVEDNYLNDTEVKKLLASFFFALDRDIEKVDNFFNAQFLEYDRRLRRLLSSAQFAEINNFGQGNTALQTVGNPDSFLFLQSPSPHNGFPYVGFGQVQSAQNHISANPSDLSEDLDEVLGILIELRSHFRNLKWYAELNKRAFTKILKKLDKKVGTNQQQTYLQARILPLGISNDAEIIKDLNIINEVLDKISPRVKDFHDKWRQDADKSGLDLRSRDSSTPVNVPLQLIERDDGTGLINELICTYRSAVLIPTRTLIALLNKAALSQSFKCVDEILEIIPTLGDHSDISSRNFFHHHVIALGKNHKKRLNAESALESAPKGDEDDLSKLLSTSLDLEAATLPDSNTRLIGAFGPDGVNSDDSPASLLYILNKLPAHLRSSLLQRDNYKRTPLHYSAQYGLFEVSKIIIESLKDWGAWNPDIPIDDVQLWGDGEGLTPLHLAVIGTHPITVKTLTSYGNSDKPLNSPRLLQLATRLNSPDLIDALLSINGFDINYPDPETHETALYIASKLNLEEATEFLLQKGADTEIGECAFGWTPVFAAATEGFLKIVKLLIQYNAKFDIFDESGWTPMEHAVLRGHLDVADMLTPEDNRVVSNPQFQSGSGEEELEKPPSRTNTPVYAQDSPGSRSASPQNGFYKQPGVSQSIDKISEVSHASKKQLLKSSLSHNKPSNGASSHSHSAAQPVKSFGHKYLQKDQSIVLITLGSTDSRNKAPAVALNKVPVTKVSSTELDTALSLVVTCPDDLNCTPVVLDLPLDDTLDSVNFTVPYKHDSAHQIYFDIVPTYSYHAMRIVDSSSDIHEESGLHSSGGSNGYHHENASGKPQSHYQSSAARSKVLGRAVALLDKSSTSVGLNRRSLSDIITIPIIENETLEVLGTVSFEFMLVTPFSHARMSVGRTETYWKSLVSTRVIGHRGLGKNMNTKKSLQLGENTVESFIAAASLGASYVEFDVQLTKDNIPVVYHDFLVAESGADIPMHELTLEQFLDLNSAEKHKAHVRDSGRRRSMDDTDAAVLQRMLQMRGQNASDGPGADHTKAAGTQIYEDRMRLTRTFKKNNFKGNSRGHSIASSFVTLKELFKKIPSNVGFNIECKYPMLDEAEEEDIGQVAVELNHWCDTVLKVVYDNANGRDIIFSSFHPDVCVMLSLKQPSIPILFLTEGGTQQMADVRAASLQSAIRFARRWNLLGIVSAARPLIKAPRLTQIVKSSGLVCVTYGVENNDPENARIEMDAGVDAVIVDSVLAVRRGLTKYGGR